MYTEVDERNGVVRCCWEAIRERVKIANPEFFKLIDKLSPDKSFAIYLAYYPYGSYLGDSAGIFLPQTNGENFRLTDPRMPKLLLKELGYGIDTSPFGMILEKNFEYFIDLPAYNLTIPKLLHSPGSFFSFTKNLSKKNNRMYASTAALNAAAGARSIFMLPKIGCNVHHNHLKRDFDITVPAAKTFYQHWQVFKALIESEQINSPWRGAVLYFSKKWMEAIHTDPAWLEVNRYLHEKAWHQFAYERNRAFYETACSLIQKDNNLKPNPYLSDTARHILGIGVGATLGHRPAVNENSAPVYLLQKLFVEHYSIEHYLPVLMEPAHFNLDADRLPIYYSLQNPTTHTFSPKSRTNSSTIFEMRELKYVLSVFQQALANNQGICQGTILNEAAKIIKYHYYHNQQDLHKSVTLSPLILERDKRFNYLYGKPYRGRSLSFAKDAKFFRGCVSIALDKAT